DRHWWSSCLFCFSSRRRHTRSKRDWSSDVCSSDLAGKTTILRTLAGLLKPTKGTVQFAGMKPNSDIRAHIGYLPQHPMFYTWMTGEEFLKFSGRLFDISKEEVTRRSDELLDVVGIGHAKSKRIGKYSGGMRQRLGIAQAMIHKPQ